MKAVLELDELKKDTAVTISIVNSAERLLTLNKEKEIHLQQLMAQMRQSYTRMFGSVQRYRLTAMKNEKLCAMFHKFSIEEGFEMCSVCDKALSLGGHEIFWQLLMETEFIRQLTTQTQGDPVITATPCSFRNLSFVKENAVRYTAGYIVRKLEQKYSKQTTQEAIECTAALKEMAGKLKTSSTTMSRSEQRSSEWTKLIDRGGLYHVEDIVYDLFVTIELLVDQKLSSILKGSGKGLEQVRKENLSWLCSDEEVQFLWCLVSPAKIENESVRQSLLQEIAYMWITTQGHSKTHKIKEDYKIAKKQTVKRKRSLRK